MLADTRGSDHSEWCLGHIDGSSLGAIFEYVVGYIWEDLIEKFWRVLVARSSGMGLWIGDSVAGWNWLKQRRFVFFVLLEMRLMRKGLAG
jgi:membrane protein YqaA with SNARE-associated domain